MIPGWSYLFEAHPLLPIPCQLWCLAQSIQYIMEMRISNIHIKQWQPYKVIPIKWHQIKQKLQMLQSKTKIRKQTLSIFSLIQSGAGSISPSKIQEVLDKKLFKDAVSMIYGVLVNFTAPIDHKINSLFFLKSLFQTAHPGVIAEAETVIPVLLDIASYTKSADTNKLYFVLKEQRAVSEDERSNKYVRLTLQILKQWGTYMIDLKQTASLYLNKYRQCQDKGIRFPEYYMYFRMEDYIEFMVKWGKNRKGGEQFKDKIKVYYFISQSSEYQKNYREYKDKLSEFGSLIVKEIYSILINHNIPVQSKLNALHCLKDFYEQGNTIYESKVQEIVAPYFANFVSLISKNIPPERYFEMVQHRVGIDYNDSREYVHTILQLVKQWSLYNSKKHINPYLKLSQFIDKNRLLEGISKPLFHQNDVKRYLEHQGLGKHREKEYIIPKEITPPLDLQGQQAHRQLMNQYNTSLEEHKKKEMGFKKQIQILTLKLQQVNKQGGSREGPNMNQPLVQSIQFQGNNNNNPITNFNSRSPNDPLDLNADIASKMKTRKKSFSEKQKQLVQKVGQSRIKSIISESYDDNPLYHTPTRQSDIFQSQGMKSEVTRRNSAILRFSDAVKHQQLLMSSRLSRDKSSRK